jgi:uncharacterized paraquat-inducible protein A
MMPAVIAIILGATMPILVLAVVVRWRLTHLINRAAASTVHRRTTRRRRAARRTSLDWLSQTLGRPPRPTADRPAASAIEVCTHCGYQNEPGSSFCRRCGQRIHRLG